MLNGWLTTWSASISRDHKELRLRLHSRHGFVHGSNSPVSGRWTVVPLVPEMRIKAGQDAEIQVRFMVGDTVLKGESIPSGQAFFGLMSWSDFSDPDGDGIATATVRLGPGEHTVHLLADGCTEAQVRIIAEP